MFATPAYAQAAGGAAAGPEAMLLQFLPLVALVVLFYFLMIRPQQKQRKLHEASIMAIKKGDQIVTAGGIVGEVVHIKEAGGDDPKSKTMEDHITIKSAESRVVVERGRIARVTGLTGTTGPSA